MRVALGYLDSALWLFIVPGCVLFFFENGIKAWLVGVFIGDGLFAPQRMPRQRVRESL